MLVYGIMQLVLHCRKESACEIGAWIIIHRCDVDIRYLLVKIAFRSPNVPNALQHLSEIAITALLQSVIIHRKTLLDILM